MTGYVKSKCGVTPTERLNPSDASQIRRPVWFVLCRKYVNITRSGAAVARGFIYPLAWLHLSRMTAYTLPAKSSLSPPSRQTVGATPEGGVEGLIGVRKRS